MGGYKAATTKLYRALIGDRPAAPWKRGYYEHVAGKKRDLSRIAEYIADNPFNWVMDDENPRFERRIQRWQSVRCLLPAGCIDLPE